MKDHSPKPIPSLLVILALAAIAASVIADEPPADGQEEHAASPKNILEWQTATEVDNFGYNIYRAESEDGPFERLNADPIPGAGTTDEPTSYEFVDDDIEPGAPYWYYLESISMSGVKERFTSIFRKEPQSVSESSGSAEDKDATDQD